MYVIGLAGGSGSGKTTFMESLKLRLDGFGVTFISLDDYYLPRDKQHVDENGIKNFDLPTSIDSHALLEDITKLRSGQHVTRQEYTFNNEAKEAKMIEFRSNPIIIIEGLFIYHYTELRGILDLKLFVHAPPYSKIIRRIKRDRVERNYPLDDVLYRYQHHVMPSYEQYIQPYMSECDIVINNLTNMDASLEVIYGFIKEKLANG